MHPKQIKIFKFIGENPLVNSYQKIADGCGLSSKSVAYRHVKCLMDMGKVKRYDRRFVVDEWCYVIDASGIRLIL